MWAVVQEYIFVLSLASYIVPTTACIVMETEGCEAVLLFQSCEHGKVDSRLAPLTGMHMASTLAMCYT